MATAPALSGALEVTGLRRSFGATEVLRGVDIHVGPGEVFGLLGPNGAGKTTTLRCLCGLLAPTAGDVRVLGLQLPAQAEALKRRIGYMSQQFSLYRDLTVRENVAFFAEVYGATDGHRTDALLDRYQLTDRRDQPAGELSGGFRQRLALVCALTHRPELLFLDEPTAGIDPITRKDLWDLFYELAAGGMTLVVTTHYMEEAERCDRLAFLVQGRVLAGGSPAEVLDGFGQRELLEVPVGYHPDLLARVRALRGVETVSQFGRVLRVVALGADHGALAAAAGVGLAEIVVGRPGLEDVFVNLAKRAEGGEGAEAANP